MNDNLNNPAPIANNSLFGVKVKSPNSASYSSYHSELVGNETTHSFDEFFDKCRKISEAERTIKEALGDLSQFKSILSQALNRPIETQYSFRNSIDEIIPVIKFWTKYGNQFKSFISGENDAQMLLDSYRQCPELKQEVDQLRAAVKDRDTQIAALQESVIAKQLDEAKNQLDDEKVKNVQLSEEISSLKSNISSLEEDLSSSRAENIRVVDESERLKEKLANELSSYQDEIGRITNAYQNKTEKVEQLQKEIVAYQIIRNLIADAFKIDTKIEAEYIQALGTAKTILRTCVEMGKGSPLGDKVFEHIEDVLKENVRMKQIEEDNRKLNEKNITLNSTIREKDTELVDQKQIIEDANEKITTLTNNIAECQKKIKDLNDSETTLRGKLKDSSASIEVRNKIIQCFRVFSDDIDSLVNTIENTENWSEELQNLKSFLDDLCKQNTRMTDFIYSIMRIRGMRWSLTIDPQEQKQILDSVLGEYKRILILCQTFEDIKHSKSVDFDIERLESNQAEMISAIDTFYQYAKKTTNDPALGNGTTLYEKIVTLPSVQEQLSRSIESAVFSINYSRVKIEESEELQRNLHDLQLQYEKKSNVLMMLERKIYPYFMTAQNLGRRDKLIDDIEFGLANDIVPALPLKSYLGLLSFVEKDFDSISDDTLLWILQQLPKALYNFYQDTVLEGATDISSDEVIYDVMNQLMNKINKFILKGSFFLSMPRLGSPISSDSMEMHEKTNSVNAVISWMISDSRHKIIHKALVK